MALPAEQTLLKLSGTGIHGVSLYSARGLKQSLEPLQEAAVIRRTINMEARSLGLPAARKYNTTISAGADVNIAPPAFDDIWPGMVVVIECIAELGYKTIGGTPARTVVAGSSRTEGDFTRYRPVLTCMIVSLTMGAEEYTAGHEWTLTATEV
jgi:hypothetical protein